MDLIKKILYTVTYPLWYMLALLMGKKDGTPAIEDGGKKTDGTDVQLAPLEKFDPDEWERSARAVHENAKERVAELTEQTGAKLEEACSQLKDNAEKVAENVQNVVRAFGEDLLPAEFIDADADDDEEQDDEDDDEEDGDASNEAGGDDDDSIENLENDDENLLPDSVKKATEELQKEIEETMKLRDQLKEAAERSQRRVEQAAGQAQKLSEEAMGQAQKAAEDAAESAKQAALEVARKTQQEMDRVAKAAQDAAKKAFADTQTAGQQAMTRVQDSVAEAGTKLQGDAKELGKRMAASKQQVEGATKNLQDELTEALGSAKNGLQQAKDTAGPITTNLDEETQDRLKAVEQAMQDDVEDSPSQRFHKK